MKRLVLEAFFLLLYFEIVARLRGFSAITHRVQVTPVSSSARTTPIDHGFVCRAVDLACAFYFRQVLCLQRSAATTVMLRRHGWPAEMVIGVQVLPLISHAWVEIDSAVVNDKPYMLDIYRVLERC